MSMTYNIKSGYTQINKYTEKTRHMLIHEEEQIYINIYKLNCTHFKCIY